MSEVRVRHMLGFDVTRVMEIAAELPTAPDWGRPVYEEAVANRTRRMALVAERSGEVIGFVVAGVIAPEAELESIAVAAAAQRLGVGRVLLDSLIAELRLVGVVALDLEVRESNQAAIVFYRRAGFREVGRRRGYYLASVEDALLLRLEFLNE